MTPRTRLLVFASVGIIATSCSPTTPSPPTTGTQLTSLKYVRTRPVVAPVGEARVMMYSRMPNINDPLGRSQLGGVPLRAVDAVTFVYDYPSGFYVPVDADCDFWVVDTAVSEYNIARDLYVNDTRIRVEQAGNYEYGHFKVDRRGRVY